MAHWNKQAAILAAIKHKILIFPICLLIFIQLATASVVIKIDTVHTMRKKFNIVNIQDIVNSRFDKTDAYSKSEKPFLTYSTVYENEDKKTIACPNSDIPLRESNPFIAALSLAFANHQRISLSPDMIWLLICQGLSIHVNQKPNGFSKLFSANRKKEKISIRHDGLRKGINDPMPPTR
jgi:hypothetical protein